MDAGIVFNLLSWALLFFLFLWAYPRYSTYWVVILLICIKAFDEVSGNQDTFALFVDGAFVVAMLVALYLCRHSPNYRWLIGCLFISTFTHYAIFASGVNGIKFYTFYLIADFATILAILFRANIAKWLTTKNVVILSRLSKDCMDQFGFSRQEGILFWLYTASMLIGGASLVEKLIRDFTDHTPLFIYSAYAPIKMIISILMFLIVFTIAVGGAKGIYDGKRIA